MEFSRQEYWNGLPFPTPGDLPDPGIKSMSPKSPELAGGFFTSDANARIQPLVWEDLTMVQLNPSTATPEPTL